MASTEYVEYLDGGWQTLVEGLRRAAEAAGANISTAARVVAIEWEAEQGVRGVRLADGAIQLASKVIVAASPEVACTLVEHGQKTVLHAWAEAVRPVTAAVLDVALKHLPKPRALFALGIDQPLYLSVHSAVAKLAPQGGALIHTAKYLSPEAQSDPRSDERELETLLDTVQPGWRAALVERRFLPKLVVANTAVLAAQNGPAGRPGPAVPGIPNLYVVGDWVGSEGMLSDASVASARQAAQMILADTPQQNVYPHGYGMPVEYKMALKSVA